MSSLTGLTSLRETPNTHYMILHWGLLPQLTMEVVPQGLDTIKKYRKEVKHIQWRYNNILNLQIHQHMHTLFLSLLEEFH